jgi:hypothetical protein
MAHRTNGAFVSDKMSAKRKYVRLSESTWAEIEGLWETGDATLPDLEGSGVTRTPPHSLTRLPCNPNS